MDKLEFVKSKIISDKAALGRLIAFWDYKDKKIVFTNGCFDILHRGHIEYLAQAANHGDVLIVGLNTDASVKRIKGENRPVNDEYSRALQVAALSFVTVVVPFEEDTPYELIKFVQPDVLVKGSDYEPADIVGADIVTAKGGKIETIQLVEGYSTTGLIEKLKKG
jgi:D-glycero-beta-D-manno-heptose 1-phosphate adenylyltransferase